MSDPVTNVEIEDVLSSIRRLVSEGDRSKTAQSAPVEQEPAQPEKLVLTPALRVTKRPDDSHFNHDEADTQTAIDQPQSVDEPAHNAPAEVASEQDLSDDWPTQGFEWRDDEGQGAAEHADDAAEDSIHHDDTSEADAHFDDAPQEDAEPVFTHVDRSDLEEKIAELEAAVTAQPEEWEPDGSEVKSEPSWPTEVYSALTDVEDAVEVEDAPQPEPQVDAADDAGDQTDAPDVAFRHLAEASDDSALVGGAMADTVVEDEHLSAYLADESVVDEAALREIVLDIVRQELQGKLGERITRNVRKLVRREIMRVLNAQDID